MLTKILAIVAIVSVVKIISHADFLALGYGIVLLLSIYRVFVGISVWSTKRRIESDLKPAPSWVTETVAGLCTTHAIGMPRVMLTSAYSRLFSFGDTPKKTSIVVPSSLLDRLTRKEVKSALSHELFHTSRGLVFWSLSYTMSLLWVVVVAAILLLLLGIVEVVLNSLPALPLLNFAIVFVTFGIIVSLKYAPAFKEPAPLIPFGYAYWYEEYLADFQAALDTSVATVIAMIRTTESLPQLYTKILFLTRRMKDQSIDLHRSITGLPPPNNWTDIFPPHRGVSERFHPSAECRVKFLELCSDLLDRGVSLEVLHQGDFRPFVYKLRASIIMDPLLRELYRIDKLTRAVVVKQIDYNSAFLNLIDCAKNVGASLMQVLVVLLFLLENRAIRVVKPFSS